MNQASSVKEGVQETSLEDFTTEEVTKLLKSSDINLIKGTSLETRSGNHPFATIERQLFDFSGLPQAEKEFQDFKYAANATLVLDQCMIVGGLILNRCFFKRVWFRNCMFVEPKDVKWPEDRAVLTLSNLSRDTEVEITDCRFERGVLIKGNPLRKLLVDNVSAPSLDLRDLVGETSDITVTRFSGEAINVSLKASYEISTDARSAALFKGAPVTRIKITSRV